MIAEKTADMVKERHLGRVPIEDKHYVPKQRLRHHDNNVIDGE